MRFSRISVVAYCLCLTTSTLTWADQPAGPAASPAAGKVHAATAQPEQATSQLGAADSSEDRFLREQGYKPEMRKGTRYYCRRQARLGSRFEDTVCLTAEQSRDMRQHSKEMVEHAQRNQGNPTAH